MTKLFSKLSSSKFPSLLGRIGVRLSPSLLGRIGVRLSPSLLGRVGVGLSPSPSGRVGVGSLLLLLLLTSCGGGKSKEAKSAAELIADADHFQVDTIVATPDDTLVSTSVDHVLRHYPELYRAAEKAQKIYSKWALQEQQTRLKTQPSLLDIRSILTELFSPSQQREATSLPTGEGRGGALSLPTGEGRGGALSLPTGEGRGGALSLPTGEGRGGAQLLDSIDTAYLRLISEAPAERKTAIGHSRKAFLAYAERLQQVAQAVPADLRERYSSIVALRLQKMQQHLQKSTTDN